MGDQVERLLERQAVTQAARRLLEMQRQVLACRFLLDLSVAETAAALGVPEGTVKSYTARALTRIRELLAEDPIATRHESTNAIGIAVGALTCAIERAHPQPRRTTPIGPRAIATGHRR